MTCGVAVISSVVTVTALASAGKHNVVQTGGDQCERGAGKLYTVSSAVTPPTDFTHASENTINGVVSIKSYATSRSNSGMDGYNNPLYEFFFGVPGQRVPRQHQSTPQERQRGLGSGVILSTDGYIVTNNHVIDGADRLEVTLNDNSIYNATVIGTDPTTDVAL